MNETQKIEQNEETEGLSVNEERMYLLVKNYLRHVQTELVVNFSNEPFYTLLHILFTRSKVEAIKYLRSLFPVQNKKWIPTNYSNNKFEEFIDVNFQHIKPQHDKYSELGLKEAKDIVDWIEANRNYTRHSY